MTVTDRGRMLARTAVPGSTGTGPTVQPPGRWLRQRRVAAGLTQEELAERSGLSQRAVSDLERDRTRRPHPRTVRLVAGALGLSQAATGELITWYRTGRATDGFSEPRPAAATVGAAPVVPRELPAAVAHFAGRAAELAALDAWLGEPPGSGGGAVVISAIGGMAGVGKTTLALHWAHRVASRFPDGQLYVNLRGHDPTGPPADPAGVIRRFLDTLGVAPARIPPDPDGQAALYRSLLARRQMLIVADNARDAGQVRALLPGAPGCLVLVTSRGQLAGLAAAEGARLVTLDVLTSADAARLLSARLGAERVAAEPEAAAELVRLCARLPLALAIAAARAVVADWPLATLAAGLAGARDRLDELDLGEATVSVRAVFSWSYRQLDAAAARLFRLLSLHPGPGISAAAAASLAGLPLPEARAVLRELAGASLITERQPGRYALHDLLRVYAGQQAAAHDSEADRRDATRRMLDHYLHTARAATIVLNPGQDPYGGETPGPGVTPEAVPDGEHASAWFGAEHKALLAVTGQAAAAGFDTHARELPQTLVTFFDGNGHWRDLVSVQHIALACCERLGDPAGQARAHRRIGSAHIKLGETGLAHKHMAQAIELAQRIGDQAEEARAHLGMSVVREYESHFPDSLACCLRALDLAKTAGHPILEAQACNNAGYDYAVLGDFTRGLGYCRRALDLLGQHASPSLEASTWDSVGYIHYHLGDHRQAIRSYLRAVSLFRERGARYQVAQSFDHLGDAHEAAGNTEAAHDAWQQALTILDELDHPDAAQISAKLTGAGPAAQRAATS
ncbi:MAG TPA: tetratricopeptide repeat protein [Streptosporangiaceae bacterium]